MQHYVATLIACSQKGHETDCYGNLVNVQWEQGGAHPRSYGSDEINEDLYDPVYTPSSLWLSFGLVTSATMIHMLQVCALASDGLRLHSFCQGSGHALCGQHDLRQLDLLADWLKSRLRLS